MDTISNPKSIRAVAATGNLSTGFLDETLSRAVRQGADFIGCDAGSSDSGPYYLGSGKPRGATDVTKRYTGSILREAVKAKIPVILGSVGHAGTRPHLHWMLDLVRELARENGWHFSLAGIDSEIDKEKLIKAFKAGQITPLDPAPIMDENTIASAERFTAMMGIEPIQRALKAGAQIVVCGRASDVAIYAALPVLHGISPGIAFHAGKILECAAASVTQRLYPDCLSAVLDDQGFTVEPPNPAMRCTPQSVASHTLYENGDPFSLVESGGTLDTSEARYSAVSDRAVRVTGGKFIPSPKYTVRLEGAAFVGYRSIAFAGVRDPLVLRQLDGFLSGLHDVVQKKVRASLGLEPEKYRVKWRIYGRNGTMGKYEPESDVDGHEVGILIDIVAPTQALAAAISPIVTHTGLHHPIPEYEGLISNFAFPFSPPGADAGPVYRFCANHVWALDDPCAPFGMTIEQL
jgi:hypothetical protein